MPKKVTNESFIENAIKVHGNKYDYSLVNYVSARKKVDIVCRTHGLFHQTPNDHLRGRGCPTCGELAKKRPKLLLDDVLKRCKQIHGDKYDYSKAIVGYIDTMHKVVVTCKKHGDFETKMNYLIHGSGGCPKCKSERLSSLFVDTKESFVEKANAIHDNKYSYDKVVYVNSQTPVIVGCPLHGDFLTYPANHTKGRGCPVCQKSHGEMKIDLFLRTHNINYVRQYKIRNENLLCNNSVFIVDFYIQNKNVIIEYNGEQHYKPVSQFGGKEQFELQQERDLALRQYCKEHKIKLIEIPYWDYNNIETILKKELKIK